MFKPFNARSNYLQKSFITVFAKFSVKAISEVISDMITKQFFNLRSSKKSRIQSSSEQNLKTKCIILRIQIREGKECIFWESGSS